MDFYGQMNNYMGGGAGGGGTAGGSDTMGQANYASNMNQQPYTPGIGYANQGMMAQPAPGPTIAEMIGQVGNDMYAGMNAMGQTAYNVGAMNAQALQTGMGMVGQDMQAGMLGMGQYVNQGLGNLNNTMTTGFGGLQNTMNTDFNMLNSSVNSGFNNMGTSLNSINNQLTAMPSSITSGINSSLNGLTGSLNGLGTQLNQGLTNALSQYHPYMGGGVGGGTTNNYNLNMDFQKAMNSGSGQTEAQTQQQQAYNQKQQPGYWSESATNGIPSATQHGQNAPTFNYNGQQIPVIYTGNYQPSQQFTNTKITNPSEMYGIHI